MPASQYYFDAWLGSDAKGVSLGELTEAYNKQFRAPFNDLGNGSFTINRHDDQAAWCATDNLIRLRFEPGGPFAWDDPRYVFAFWIEEGADVTISSDEEGGEEYTREGRGIMAYLERAIVYNKAFSTGTGSVNPGAGYWSWAEGVHSGAIMNRLMNEVKARFAAGADTWYAIEDFGDTHDSDGDIWPELDEKYQVTIGTDYLSVIGLLQDLGQQYGMDPDFALHGWNDHSRDLTGTIAFTKGVNIREAAERQIHASPAKSRALIRGATKSGSIIYREIASPGTEAAIGRREGYVEYTRTASSSILGKAGVQYLRKLKLHHDGPQTIGVTIGDGTEFADGHYIPWTDYRPGDFVKVHIPGEYSHATVKVNAIVGSESDSGQPEITIEFEETPFTESPGPAQIGANGGSGPGDCTDCPPQSQPPFVPGSDCTGDIPVHNGTGGTDLVNRVAIIPGIYSWRSGPEAVLHPGDAQYHAASLTFDWPAGKYFNCHVEGALLDGAVNHGFRIDTPAGFTGEATVSPQWPIFTADGGHGTNANMSGDLTHWDFCDAVARGPFENAQWVIDLYSWVAGPCTDGVCPLGSVRIDPGSYFWLSDAPCAPMPDCLPNEPRANQPVGGGEIVALANTDDGVTTQAQTNYPYTATSLRVSIRPTDPVTSDYGALQEVIPIETDPASGLFSLNFLLPEGWEIVIRAYQASSGTHTSAANTTPAPSTFALFPSDVVEEQREFGLAADVGLSFAYARGDATGGTPDDPLGSSVLDDLTDVVIAAPANADRLRYSTVDSLWHNSPLRWEPHVDYTGSVVLDGAGNPVMAEVY